MQKKKLKSKPLFSCKSKLIPVLQVSINTPSDKICEHFIKFNLSFGKGQINVFKRGLWKHRVYISFEQCWFSWLVRVVDSSWLTTHEDDQSILIKIFSCQPPGSFQNQFTTQKRLTHVAIAQTKLSYSHSAKFQILL